MKRICYMSRARWDLSAKDRADILRSSRRNNAADEITGLLLCDGFRFLQAIEGRIDRIDTCFDRICADHRHYDVVVFDDDRIDRREFGHWSLNSRYQFDLDLTHFRTVVANDVRDVVDARLKAMFIGFASLAR